MRALTPFAVAVLVLLLVPAACRRAPEAPTAAEGRTEGALEARTVDAGRPGAPTADAPAAPAAGGDTGTAAPPPAAPAAGSDAGTAAPEADFGTAAVEAAGTETGTAVLRAVRTGRHDDFDRVVFELAGAGRPGTHVAYVHGPVVACGSGEKVKVAGGAFLEIRMEPAQAHDEEGRVTVADRDRHLDLPAATQLVLTCDFEGVLTWVLGVPSERPFRVTALDEPARIVVDVRH